MNKRTPKAMLAVAAAIFAVAASLATFGTASAADATSVALVPDVHGPDDEAGQSDLSYLGMAAADPADTNPAMLAVIGFDDTAQTGNNTSDACGLLDGDGDGFVDFALCFSLGGPTMDFVATDGSYVVLYDCKDTALNRCFYNGGGGDGSAGIIAADTDGDGFLDGTNTSCHKSPPPIVDPFAAEAGHAGEQDPALDTQVVCNLVLADMAELDGTVFPGLSLVNACTFPSPSANSDDKDCLVNPGSRFISTEIVVTGDTSVRTFTATLDGPGDDDSTSTFTTTGGDTNVGISSGLAVGSGEEPVTYTLTVTGDGAWDGLGEGVCYDQADPSAPPQSTTSLTIGPGQTFTCVFDATPGDATSYQLTDAGLGEGATCDPVVAEDRLPRSVVNPDTFTAETPIYSSSFDGDDGAWLILSGSWSVVDGVFKQLNDCGADYTALLMTSPLANYRFTVDFADLGGVNHGGVIVGQAHPDTRSGAWLIDLADGGSTLRWGSYDNAGYYQNVGSQTVTTPATGQWVNLSVQVLDNVLSITYEGAEITTVPITTGDGHVGLVANAATVAYDNISLTALPSAG